MSLSRTINMLALCVTLVVVGCGHVNTEPAPQPAPAVTKAAVSPTKPPIRVLTWNLEHFVDPFDNPYIENQFDNVPQVKSQPALQNLAQALRILDADVIGFEEVEGDTAVKFFIDSYIPDNTYKYYACLPSREWHQNVVIASRFPIGAITSFREVEIYNDLTKTSRNNINSRLTAAEINVSNDYAFLMLCLHLKAGSTPEDAVWRQEQIRVVKNFLDKQASMNPDENVVVVGDMNMVPNDPEFTLLETLGNVKLASPFQKLGFPLTHASDSPTRSIDHIFLNDAMAREYVPDSASIPLPLSMDRMSSIADHLPALISIYPEDL